MNRIVWDSTGHRTYLNRTTNFPAVLSGSVGRIVGALRSDDPATVSRIRQKYPTVYKKASAAGWLGAEWTFRTVDRSPHQKRVQIEVALRCNLRCHYCYSMSGPHQKARIGGDRVLSLIEEADRLGVLTIDFTGGELLLDRAWSDYVALARSAGIAVTIHTNGTLLREAQVAVLSRLGVAAVQVSLDSHLAQVHDAARGHPGALRRTLRGLDLLQDAGLPIRLSVMAHKDNLDTLGDTIRFMARRYRSAILNVDRVIATGGALNYGNGLSAEEYWTFLRPYLGDNVRAGRVCESSGLADFEPDCGVAYSYVYITAQGEIAACPTMTSREDLKFHGPSINETSLHDAWYTSYFFNSFRYTNCENVSHCSAGSSCGGGCRSNAYVESGYVTAPDVIACNTHKNRTKVFIDFPQRYSKGEYGAVGPL